MKAFIPSPIVMFQEACLHHKISIIQKTPEQQVAVIHATRPTKATWSDEEEVPELKQHDLLFSTILAFHVY